MKIDEVLELRKLLDELKKSVEGRTEGGVSQEKLNEIVEGYNRLNAANNSLNDVQRLRIELNDLKTSLEGREVSEIGLEELNQIVKNYTRINEANHRAAINARNNPNMDTEELRNVLDESDVLWNEVREFSNIAQMFEVKKAYLRSLHVRRNTLISDKESYLRAVATLEQLNATVSDPAAREVGIKTIENYREYIAKNDKELEEIKDEIHVLLKGGSLPKMDDFDFDKFIEEENARREAEEAALSANPLPAEPVVENNEPTQGEPVVNPLPAEPVVGDDEPTQNGPTVIPAVVPVGEQPVVNPLPAEPIVGDDEPTTNGPVVIPTVVPTGTQAGGINPLPAEPVVDDDEVMDPEVDSQTQEETPEDDEEKVAEVVQAKPSLLKKIAAIIGLALTFVTAWHTGLIANDVNEIATMMEEENDDKDLDETEGEEQEETPEEEKQPDQPSQPEQKQPEQKQPEQKQAEQKQPEQKQEEKKPGEEQPDKPSQPDQPSQPDKPDKPDKPEQPDQPFVPVEEAPIILGAGEVAYDTSTGVEISADGTAVLHNEDGTVESQERRDLEHTEDGKSIVTNEDLKEDTELPTETEEEIPYEEAVESMTEGEKENLDEAIADFNWEDYFNDTYGEGTSLTP